MNILLIILGLIKTLPRLFWITTVLPIIAAFKAWKSGEYKRVHQIWSKSIGEYFQVQYNQQGGKITQEKDVVFLCNHRTQADFFIYDKITNFKANVLSRKEVAYVFPFTWIINPGTIWFFNRKNVQIQKFNQWLDSQFEQSFRDSLIVFPEGHRMYRATQVKSIKSGMIKYSYMRKKKIQITICFGNQQVFNERQIKLNFGKKLYYWFSELIDPVTFPTQQEFVNHVSERFKTFFADCYKQYTEILKNVKQQQKQTKQI